MLSSIKKLTKLIQNKKIILIGETHGVVENTVFIKNLVQTLKKENEKIKFVGFEYPPSLLQDFQKSKNYNEMVNTKLGKMLIQDGRFSKAHFKLLLFLNENNIPILFFNSAEKTWNKRDKKMAENIKKKLDKKPGKAIVIAGNLHTKITKFKLEGNIHIPMGSYFNPEKTLLINLKYHQGSYFNFGRKKFQESKMPKNSVEKINKNKINFHIKKGNPTK